MGKWAQHGLAVVLIVLRHQWQHARGDAGCGRLCLTTGWPKNDCEERKRFLGMVKLLAPILVEIVNGVMLDQSAMTWGSLLGGHLGRRWLARIEKCLIGGRDCGIGKKNGPIGVQRDEVNTSTGSRSIAG